MLTNFGTKLECTYQIAYIRSWQPGAHPFEVDKGFIESLKNELLSSLPKINS